jgi:GDP/UDP-N,N'-diacetylbacillosamine 2-epimerase (hydrolysing)
LEKLLKKILRKMNLLKSKKKVCFVTGSRSEYGLLRNILIPLKKEKTISSKLIVTGSHLLKQYGNTSNEILRDKIKIFKKIKISKKNDNPGEITKIATQIINGLTNIFKRYKPDLIVVLGDRYEIFVTCYVATIFKIPIAHICGGEETLNSYDNQFRHAITKMSHIHFATTNTYKNKILKMGENSKNVFNYGSLAFSNLKNRKFKNKYELEKKYKIKFKKENFLITFHPETIDNTNLLKNIDKIFNVFTHSSFSQCSFIFTASNNDHDGGKINAKILRFVNVNKNSYFIHSFGQDDYFSMLKNISGVIGNSSSGIIEVPSFKIGTINIGTRQQGRIFAKSVINCSFEANDVKKNIKKIISKKFRSNIKDLINPYYKKDTSKKIKKILIKINLKKILFKTFKIKK